MTMKINTIRIIFISLMALVSVVDTGCSCGGGNWDPSAFLNSEDGTGHSQQHDSAGDSEAGNSGSGTHEPVDRVTSFPNGALFKSMKSVSSSDAVIDVSYETAIYYPSKCPLH